MVHQLLTMGPMPDNPINIGENTYILKKETNVQIGELFHTFQYYWPSSINPPYPIPEGCIWSWNEEEDERIWFISSLF